MNLQAFDLLLRVRSMRHNSDVMNSMIFLSRIVQWQHTVLVGDAFSISSRVAARGRTAAVQLPHLRQESLASSLDQDLEIVFRTLFTL